MDLFSDIIPEIKGKEKEEWKPYEQDIMELAEAYKEARDAGSPKTSLRLADLYKRAADAWSDEKMGEKAVSLYAGCAREGEPAAWRELGHIYKGGKFVSRDMEKGRKCFRKALDMGDAESAWFLGKMYAEADGTEIDLKKAAEVYRRGAELGAPDAKGELGIAYFTGRGVRRDYNKAFPLLLGAHIGEENSGDYYLSLCYFNGLGTEIDEEEGFRILEHASDIYLIDRRDEARKLLIDCYEKGIGTERSLEKAQEVRDAMEADRENNRQIAQLLAQWEW